MTNHRNADLEAYLDEALPTEEMTRIEAALRADSQLAAKLAEIIARRDGGLISLGAVWRRHRLSCPTRQELGSYLLGLLPEEVAGYLEFHLDVAGCRYCQANLADLKEHQGESHDAVKERRRKYFQSSAGKLRKER